MTDGTKRKVRCFEDLFIWQKAVELAKDIYLVTEKNGLKKEYLNFLNIAKGSAGEIRSQLYVAYEVGYLEKEELENLKEKAKFLSGSISNHAKAIAKAVSRKQ